VTSVRCTDFSATSFGSSPGLRKFVSELRRFGTLEPETTATGCARSVTCFQSLSSTELSVCNAAREYMQLKKSIRKRAYRCDLFENVANSSLSCDVKDMICDDTGHCQNDCLNHAGQVRRKRIQCTLPEFVAYMLDSGTRVQKAFEPIGRCSTACNATCYPAASPSEQDSHPADSDSC